MNHETAIDLLLQGESEPDPKTRPEWQLTEALRQAIEAKAEDELRKSYPDAKITEMYIDLDKDDPKVLRINAAYTTGRKTKTVRMKAQL